MRTLLVSALVASASASYGFYEASEYGDAPASLVAGDCLAKEQAFVAIIAPGMECDTLKEDWCSDATCKTSASSFYEACKADPKYGPVTKAVKIAMELMGCDPSATEGA